VLTPPFIAALGSVEGMDTCRVWEQKQLMLSTAYPSFWDQISIYMSETCVAYNGCDLKALIRARWVRSSIRPATHWSLMSTALSWMELPLSTAFCSSELSLLVALNTSTLFPFQEVTYKQWL